MLSTHQYSSPSASSQILPTCTLFSPHIAGAPSVVSPTSLPQSSFMSVTLWHVFKNVFSCRCPMHRFNVQYFLCNTQIGIHSTMKMASCAVSVMSVLSSTAREYAIKSLLLSVNCVLKSVAIWQTWSATVFLLRLTFTNICFLSGHKMSHTFRIQCFRNSPSVNGLPDLAISSALKFAFTAASLCVFALVNKICCDVGFFLTLLLTVASDLYSGFSTCPDFFVSEVPS